MESTLEFLTEKVARNAVITVLRATTSAPLSAYLKRQVYVIVVLVPASYEYPTEPLTLLEYKAGQSDETQKYLGIARGKAKQVWHNRQDGSIGISPHLLFGDGDVCVPGGVKREGIVVACSGVQPHFDRLIASMVADLCIAFAYDNYARWLEDERAKGKNPAVT